MAAAISVSASLPSIGNRATPADTDIGLPATAGRTAIPSMTRRATVAPAEPGATRTNSSPPIRPTVSTRRTDSARTAATRAEDVVAGLGAALAVGGLEVVDVEQRERQLAALARRPGDLELEDPGDGPLVGEAGQRVRVGHPLEPLGALGRRSRRAGPDRPRRRRATASAVRVSRSASSSVRGAGQPIPIEPRTTSTPPLDTIERQVGPDERAARRLHRLAIEGRRRGPARPTVNGWPGSPTSAARSVAACVVHPARGDELQPGAIRVRDEDRRHRRMRAPTRRPRAGHRASRPGRRPRRRRRWRPGDRRVDRGRIRRWTLGTPARTVG